MRRNSAVAGLLGWWSAMALLAGVACVKADEGMWLFNDLPIKQLKQNYGFEPDEAWAEKLMRSCVRFNSGGSASFVSSNGLVLTNHHVGAETLHKLSTPERNVYEDGYLARTTAEELKAPDLELNQLISIEDVTATVNQGISAELSPEAAVAKRRENIAAIEQKSLEATGLRSDVVTLFGGGKYHLYRYKKYTDVRLVFSPEASIAFFGGDADNFEYPRYCLDACIFRVYENDQPAETPDFLKWSENGPAEGELVFVAGNPGRTSRIFTTDALRYQRDHRMPFMLDFLRRREIMLQQFGLAGPEQARRAKDDLFGVQNSRKAYLGMLGGLQDPAVMADKLSRENQLKAAIEKNPKLQPAMAAYSTIAEIQRQRTATLRTSISMNSQVFSLAHTIVQLVVEDQKPSGSRLPPYRDSGRASLELGLYSDAPIYPDLEQAILADLLGRLCEIRGGDDPLCQEALNGLSPTERAREVIAGTSLLDPQKRRELVAAGADAVRNSSDPLIQLAWVLDPQLRKQSEMTEAWSEQERQAYAKIADALFAVQGDSTYPDATFTLRLAYGTVKGYEEDGKPVTAFSTIGGAFEHEANHQGEEFFELPESWTKNRAKLDPKTPFNFVATPDIIGGNSGSPVVNKNLELVGLIFDGNIQSLVADFMYTDKQGRCTSVHSSAIRETLRQFYDAKDLADSLGK
ncbi:MAG: S46 family peptidase [Planctomycetaceae bacterium]|nr:S46 family peptidase [Planctomycetaceae bacterium]